MRSLRLSDGLVLVGIGSLLAALLTPVYVGRRPIARPTVCLSNVKQSTLALVMYSSDENDRFPLRDSWMEATYPYTKSESIWHCPETPKGAYGYAFNAALSGVRPPKNAVDVPLIYESLSPIRNASDAVTSLPSPGRHPGQDGPRNSVGYADGHAKMRIMR